VCGGVIALCVASAGAEITMSLSTDATHTDLLKGGTTEYTATVGNDAGSSGGLDWSVDNNGTTGLTLSGSGTGLTAGTTTPVTGS